MNFDRILVPVDFSHDSLAALEHAIALAKKLTGPQTVIALHVVDDGLPVSVSTGIARGARAEGEQASKKDAKQKLDKFLAGIDPGEELLEADVVIHKPASEAICLYAASKDIDIIVIGAQGKAGALRRFVLGSTMEQVQKGAPCAVLAVKDPARNQSEE